MADNSGTSFPSGVNAGFRFFRTDLNEWFEYQPGFAGWLGDSRFYATCNVETTQGPGPLYPRMMSGTSVTRYSATIGWPAPFDAKLWRAAVYAPASSTCTVTIHINGTAILDEPAGSTILIPLVAETYAQHSNSNSDVVSEGDIAAIHLTSGTATNGLTVMAEFRRFEPA